MAASCRTKSTWTVFRDPLLNVLLNSPMVVDNLHSFGRTSHIFGPIWDTISLPYLVYMNIF